MSTEDEKVAEEFIRELRAALRTVPGHGLITLTATILDATREAQHAGALLSLMAVAEVYPEVKPLAAYMTRDAIASRCKAIRALVAGAAQKASAS